MVNTLTYIALLVIACTIIYFALRKRISFDEKFFFSLIPYILIGISLRVLMHQIEAGLIVIEGITKTANPLEIGFWFFTPGVWITTFVLVIIGLLIAGVLTKFDYRKMLIFGTIIALPIVAFNLIQFNNWLAFIAAIIIILAISGTTLFLVNKFTNYKILREPLNKFIVIGQGIDGIASAIAISFFGFSEQHVVSSAVINIHPALFALIKLILAVLICWSLDDYMKEKLSKLNSPGKTIQLKNKIDFIKLIIAILGFATGLASLFKLGII
jgi:uncharacterized membrane protein